MVVVFFGMLPAMALVQEERKKKERKKKGKRWKKKVQRRLRETECKAGFKNLLFD